MKRWLKLLGIAVLLLIGGGIALAWTPEGNARALAAKYAGPASRFLTLAPGLRVHIRDEGPRDAPVIVLLHGSNASLHTWDDWARRLSGRYRVIRYDQWGHGLTGAHPRRDYSEPAYVVALDLIARRLSLPPFILAGNSFGGEIAWKYAAAHPNRVKALVLVDAAGAPAARPAKLPIGFRIVQSPVLAPLVRHLTPRFIIESSLKDSVSVQRIVTPAMVDRYFDLLIHPGNRQATLDRATFRRAQASPDMMARLTMPVLLMWGADDKLIPLANARWFATNIKGAQLIAYPGIGHIPMEEAPDRSVADLIRWLDGLPE